MPPVPDSVIPVISGALPLFQSNLNKTWEPSMRILHIFWMILPHNLPFSIFGKFLIFFLLFLDSERILSQTMFSSPGKKESIIGGENKEIIFQWAGICTDSKGSIYLSDMMDFSLKKLDWNGNLILKCGRKGQGPGEFTGIRHITYGDSQVYVVDQYSSGIQVFSSDLEYLFRIPVQYPVQDLAFWKKDRLMIAPLSVTGSGRLLLVDHRGNEILKLIFAEHCSFPLGNTVRFEVLSDSTLILMYQFSDRIQCIDIRGFLIWETSLLGCHEVNQVEARGFQVPEKIIFTDIACDSQDSIYILGGDFS
jgi:hypothetical protein